MLTLSEIEGLFSSIEKMADKGQGVVFISHKLGEVLRICDRITVMRDGRSIATVTAANVTRKDLAHLMVGREVVFRLEKPDQQRGQVLLEVRGLCAKNDADREALRDVSFELHRGEILGFAGVAGNGQYELAEVITGLRGSTAGGVVLNGEETTGLSAREIIRRGVAHIPEKTREMGVLPTL